MSAEGGVEIVGQGLAGCCLGWHLHWRGEDFRAFEDGRKGAASQVAAGLLNPVTGKNFEPSWRIGDFLPEAVDFYEKVGAEVGIPLWFPLSVVRLVAEKEWGKVSGKLEQAQVAPWVERVEENLDGWRAAVTLRGGGRVDVKGFCAATKKMFEVRTSKLDPSFVEDSAGRPPSSKKRMVRCEGAFGLMGGAMGDHRCAKGEILTLRIPGGGESRILIGGGGWLVPVGNGLFRAGSTYEWEKLNGEPTMAGRIRVEEILERLGVENFEVVAHEAGIRPIIRRSMPLIGRLPDGSVGFNGLGSKGSLYAPGTARRLVDWLLEGKEIEEDLDLEHWMGGTA
ncbi:NAD(P)/FAD-dependent oxidoreductase [Haloferula sp.]|uniref:NAD(P)/FAD-dependent oxidoreductase n=1 Tax=Haloferula sp. TaxID=2497595 RepID=UPI00329AA301